MNLNRIKGILIQEFFITLRSFEVISDIIIFPGTTLILFGLLATYLAGITNITVAYSLLMGMLLWHIITIVQYSISVGSLWNIWSRNLSNMLITPISLFEYICAYTFSGILKAIIMITSSAFLIKIVFHFNIFDLGIANLGLYTFNLILFAISFGMVMLGLIFRYGTRIQAFAWGILPIVQPLTSVLYPVSVLPGPLQTIAYLMPPTYVFEALRANVLNPHIIQWNLFTISLGENIIYFALATWFFIAMFNQSKNLGQFARLEG